MFCCLFCKATGVGCDFLSGSVFHLEEPLGNQFMCCTKKRFLCGCFFPRLLHSRINNKILEIPVQTRDTFVKNIKLTTILLFSVFSADHCVYIEYIQTSVRILNRDGTPIAVLPILQSYTLVWDAIVTM